MTIKFRSTETPSHPIKDRLFSEFIISDIQGFIFQSNDAQLLDATDKGLKSIKIQCLEAVEMDKKEELESELILKKEEWLRKINTANFFGSNLLLLTHLKGDTCLFRLYDVTKNGSTIILNEINSFGNESEFMGWWKSIKLLSQTKATYEARARQNLTIFDNIIEKNGSAWGGNIDGFILSDSQDQVRAIIEVRQTHRYSLDKYDPAQFFLGTATKGGDFKTWLPLVYLKKAYNIPIILITISTLDKSRFGYAEVEKIDRTTLYYKSNVPPYQNLTNDTHKLKEWLISTKTI
jgi:hypothetical protein